MIRIGGRVGFDRIEQLESRFRSIDFPIELALPWRYRDLWLPMEDRAAEIIAFFKNSNIEILSMHATQGRITEERFLRWGRLTLQIARDLGVRDVTIHPNIVKRQRGWAKEQALRLIRKVKGKDVFSIETFSGKHRVFTPMELVEAKLPMTLDTAHIHNRNMIMNIINRSHPNIKTVHLSAVGEQEHHLPIDEFCVRIVDKLVELEWSGNVILEYLPWHHYRVSADIKALKSHMEDGNRVKLQPVSDQFRYDHERWGYNPDGSD